MSTIQGTNSPKVTRTRVETPAPVAPSGPTNTVTPSDAGTVSAPEATRTSNPTVQSAADARARIANDAAATQLRGRAESQLVTDGYADVPADEQAKVSNASNRRRSFTVEGAGDTDGVGPNLTQTKSGATTIISGTAGDDNIQVSPLAGGGVRVTNGGDTIDLTAAEAGNLRLEGLGGDDRVYIDPSIKHDITIDGGAGNDTLTGGSGDDTIIGGDGNDYIRGAGGDDNITGGIGNDVIGGGDGNDYIDAGAGNDNVVGGDGRDSIYGMDGDDRISGGDGRDYIDGGAGNDRLGGDGGIDQLIGGLGDDDLRGGDGDDVLAGGGGTDAYNGDAGADRVFHQDGEWIAADAADTRTEVDMSGPALGSSITIDPAASPEFRARVESDLEALRSLPSGRQLLSDLDATGRTTTITETGGFPAAGYTSPGDRFRVPDPANPGSFINGTGTDTTVTYNPSVDSVPTAQNWGEFPPIVGLFHELVHAEDAGNGAMYPGNDTVTGERNRERQAVGLPFDHDGNPATPNIQPNTNSENGLRDELNLEPRTQYNI